MNEQLISDLQFITRATEEPSEVNQLPLMKPAVALRGHVCRRIIRLLLHLLFQKWLEKKHLVKSQHEVTRFFYKKD